MSESQQKVMIDYLILANHVETINGLLYISGAGWTVHTRRIPVGGVLPNSHLGIGLSLCVPFNETNQPHQLSVRIVNTQTQQLIANVEAQLAVGRPAILAAGGDQHVLIGFPLDIVFPAAGQYQLEAHVDAEGDIAGWPFYVQDAPYIPDPAQGV